MSFIIVLIVGIIVAVFAGFNTAEVSINFIFAKYELSLTIIILISAMIGALAMFIIGGIKSLKLKRKIKLLSAKLTELGIDVSLIIGKSAKQIKAEQKAEQKARKQAEKEAKKQAKQQAKEQAKQQPAAAVEPQVAEPVAAKTVEKTTELPLEKEADSVEKSTVAEVEKQVVEQTTNQVVKESTDVDIKPADDDKFSGEV